MSDQIYFSIIGNNFYSLNPYPFRIGKNTLSMNTGRHEYQYGFYYTTAQYIFEYVYYGDKVCKITIPKDANHYTIYGKFLSEEIVIDKIMPLWDIETIQYLVYLGADIHIREEFILRHAVYKGFLDVVLYLISIGANIHVYDHVDTAIYDSRMRDCIKYFEEYVERLKKMNLFY